MSINKRVAELLRILNVSQKDFADNIGISKSQINRIVSDKDSVGLIIIIKIVSHYKNVNLEWLILGQGTALKVDKKVNQKSGNEKLEKEISELKRMNAELEKKLEDALSRIKDKDEIIKMQKEKIETLNNAILQKTTAR